MMVVINILYLLFILLYIFASLFIIYHLVKYTIHSSLNYVALVVFIAVSIPLLIGNIILFNMINWKEIISNFLPI